MFPLIFNSIYTSI